MKDKPLSSSRAPIKESVEESSSSSSTISATKRILLKELRKQKTETEIKILIPNKLLARLQLLLAKMKAGNNSCKLENEIRQILYLLYQHKKSPKNFTTI